MYLHRGQLYSSGVNILYLALNNTVSRQILEFEQDFFKVFSLLWNWKQYEVQIDTENDIKLPKQPLDIVQSALTDQNAFVIFLFGFRKRLWQFLCYTN